MPILNQQNEYRVSGYATTFGEPYVIWYEEDKPICEVMDPHALDEADMSDVIMLYDHEGRVYARTKNETVTLTVDDHGLRVDADLGRTENARNLYEDIAAGMITEMSWSFHIIEEDYDRETRTWTIRKVGKVYDVSAVSIPANPGTEISAKRKALMDGAIQRERTERSKREAEERRLQLRKRLLRIKFERMRGAKNDD